MAHNLTREDLKRNELGEALGAGVHFAGHHVKAILGGIGAVAAVALLIWGIWSWRGARADSASERLGLALAVSRAAVVETGARPGDLIEPTFSSAQERDARARELFAEIAENYGSTGAGQGAQIWLGERALADGDAEEARRLWRGALGGGDNGAFAAAARLDLAQLDRVEGRGEELVAELSRELQAANGPLPEDALLAELARTFQALDQIEKARESWQRLADEHPNSAYAATARQQLSALPTG